MHLFVKIVGLGMLLALCSCNDQAIYKQTSHAADSLNGALNLAEQQLLKADTITLKKAIAKSKEYHDFVLQHVSDTLLKAEADQLQKMLRSAEQLQAFDANRTIITNRAKLVSSQLVKLAADAEKRANEATVLQAYFQKELEQAQLLLHSSAEQQNLFQTALAEFKAALPGVEALIRKRNRGELPAIIKDTLSF